MLSFGLPGRRFLTETCTKSQIDAMHRYMMLKKKEKDNARNYFNLILNNVKLNFSWKD